MDYLKVTSKPYTVNEDGSIVLETFATMIDGTIKSSIRRFKTLKEFHSWRSPEQFADMVYPNPLFKYIPPIDWSKVSEKR